jgi:uncharacterized membrane protein YcgQ (UPF0703/DUF1980 family)
MSESNQFFGETKKELQDYLNKRVLLIKMQVSDKAARLVASAIVYFMLAFFSMCVFFFLSMVGVYYFAGIYGNDMRIGFAIMAGVYLLVLLIIYLFRKKIAGSVTDTVLKALFNDDETL